MPILMERNQTMSLKVVSITENAKTFQRGNQTCHRHDIYVVDGKGNTDRFEYINDRPTQEGAFVIGVMQYMQCVYPSEKGYEVKPWDPASIPQPPSHRSTPVPHPPRTIDAIDPPQPNCYTIKMSGESITFCMAWAKDLVVAEIEKREDHTVTDADLDRVIKFADKLNEAICDRVAFGKQTK